MASAIRFVVTGWVRRNSGMLESYSRVARAMRSKNTGMALGSNSALARILMPSRSASSSFARVKLICAWTMPACTPAMAAAAASEEMVAPSNTAPSRSRDAGPLKRLYSSNARNRWFWVTWAISWAITEASSLSDSVASTRPV